MSREIRELIAQLEMERDAAIDFVDLLQEQVRTHQITETVAQEILRREFHGHHYTELIALKNREIQEAQAILRDERTKTTNKAVPAAVVLLIGVALVMNFGAITGLFTFNDETYYSYTVGQDYTSDTVVMLPFTHNISSLRVDGTINGTGKAYIYLLSGNAQYLVASFTPQSNTGLLTGLVTGEENQTNETTIEPLPTNESNETQQAPEAIPETTPPAVPEVIELQPTPPPEQPTEETTQPLEMRTQELDNECQETCALTNIQPPYQLRIKINGDAQVHLDQLIYGELPTQPEEPTPAVEETPQTQLKTIGEPCETNDECLTGACTQNIYQGTASAKICTQQNMCVAQNTAYAAETVLADSTCKTGSKTLWLANPGTGRLEIKTSSGTLAAVIDKYGTMAVTGRAQFNTQPQPDGWVITDATGTPKLSINEEGLLQATGTLVERTTPGLTAGGDFIVRDKNQQPKAVFTETGAVVLAGDFASEVDLQ